MKHIEKSIRRHNDSFAYKTETRFNERVSVLSKYNHHEQSTIIFCGVV